MTDLIRAVRMHGRGDVRVERIEPVRPGPGDVEIAVAYAGICGSDVSEYRHGPIFVPSAPHPLTGVTMPVVLGHELSGVVIAVGEEVTRVRVGDRVTIEPLETCGECAKCLSGNYHLCPKRAAHGLARPSGGFADRTVVRERMVHVLPDEVSLAAGALVEPMAVGLHAVKRTRAGAGDVVVVHGFGPIGLACAFALRDRGAEVVVSDPAGVRRDIARRLAFTHVLDPAADDVAGAVAALSEGRGASAAIDASGAPAALASAYASTRPDGEIVVVAVPHQSIEIPVGVFRCGEVRLSASVSTLPDDFADVIASMATGGYPLDEWVEEIEFEDLVPRGLARDPGVGRLKTLVRVGGDAL